MARNISGHGEGYTFPFQGVKNLQRATGGWKPFHPPPFPALFLGSKHLKTNHTARLSFWRVNCSGLGACGSIYPYPSSPHGEKVVEMSIVWIGLVLALSLVVAGGTSCLMLHALFRAISAQHAKPARSED